MKATYKEEKRATRFLQSKGIDVKEITHFWFMQRHIVETRKHSDLNKYGPGLLTVQLQSGAQKVVVVHTRNHPTSVIRTLIAAGIPFMNLQHQAPVADPQPAHTYKRASLYMFWYFAIFIVSIGIGNHFILHPEYTFSIYIAMLFFAGSIYAIYLLQTRFCYLKLDEKQMSVYSVGRVLHYPYEQLLKVNFDFARELNATHVMEVLDNTYRYRLLYIGRTPRKSLNEIAERLRKAGVDATCSLNDNKKHYHDVYHAQ